MQLDCVVPAGTGTGTATATPLGKVWLNELLDGLALLGHLCQSGLVEAWRGGGAPDGVLGVVFAVGRGEGGEGVVGGEVPVCPADYHGFFCLLLFFSCHRWSFSILV